MIDNYDPGKLDFKNESAVITDPCYIIPKIERGFADANEWDKCDYGSSMDKLGFTKFLTRSNGFGDGGWKVVNKKDGKLLGEIWADSGQTGISLLDEVKKYNPDARIFFPAFNGGRFGAIIIENFTGEISWKYRVSTYNWDGKDYNSYYLVLTAVGKSGDREIDFSVDFGHVNYEEE